MTQNEQILSILVERGETGLNSFERLNGGVFAAQLPRCINDLEKLGYEILSIPQKNRSVNYVLMGMKQANEPEPKTVHGLTIVDPISHKRMTL